MNGLEKELRDSARLYKGYTFYKDMHTIKDIQVCGNLIKGTYVKEKDKAIKREFEIL